MPMSIEEMDSDFLKPSRNKKGLTFVGMLVFNLFLNFDQLPAAKKRFKK